jgi:hypothetical protein
MTMTIPNNSSAKRITVQIPTASGDAIEAWVYLPEGSGPHPAVVMAHGIGGIKAGGLAPFAERFRGGGLRAGRPGVICRWPPPRTVAGRICPWAWWLGPFQRPWSRDWLPSFARALVSVDPPGAKLVSDRPPRKSFQLQTNLSVRHPH